MFCFFFQDCGSFAVGTKAAGLTGAAGAGTDCVTVGATWIEIDGKFLQQ